MSISMHIDEYMEKRGIKPDDTVIPESECQVFSGNVEEKPGDAASKDRVEQASALIRELLQ